MSRIDRASLLQFLKEPHFAHDVAEHFGISQRYARLNLRQAIEAGQVLISKNSFLQTLKSSNGKLRRIRQTLYVSKKSSITFDGWKKFKLRTTDISVSQSKNNLFPTGFRSLKQSLIAKDIVNQKLSAFSRTASQNKTDSVETKSSYRTKGVLASEFDMSSTKAKLASHRMLDQASRFRLPLPLKTTNSLSHVDRIRLFQALFRKPLTFLDLHGCFGVSRQMVKGLVKNGLIAETWATKGIGVRFKLTRKGKAHLRELEAAAQFEPNLAKKAFVQLKQRAFF
jgi:hypothetical protein